MGERFRKLSFFFSEGKPSSAGDLLEGNDLMASASSDKEKGLLIASLSLMDKHGRLSGERKESITDMSLFGCTVYKSL